MKRPTAATARPVRKKPCPYCGKRLQAPTKHKWRNNLARHLGNTCAPYQREHIQQMTRFVFDLLRTYFPSMPQTGLGNFDPSTFLMPEDPQKRKAEVAELERLHNLETESE